MSQSAVRAVPVSNSAERAGRLSGLDGIRGLAALFVLLHHCYLLSFPGYPANTGPAWAGWLLYGHLAVVVFIVLSGFSLAVGPARAGWRTGPLPRFARRRAWRILPPYWAALTFSLIMSWGIAAPPGSAPPTGRTVVAFGLLLQDVVGAPTPNGAFWSIAVEAQLYLILPLLLLARRRIGAVATVGAVTVVVVTIGAAAPVLPALRPLMHLAPQFAALFALGAVTAGIVTAGDRARRVPWHWLAAALAAPALVATAVLGSVWWFSHMFWIDLAVGPATACLLAAVAVGRPRSLVRTLDAGPVRRLGRFSYSLYLVHAPIVVAVSTRLVAPRVTGVGGFLVTLAVAVPVAVGTAWAFSAVFEAPFQRYRAWAPLRAAIRNGLRQESTKAPVPTYRAE